MKEEMILNYDEVITLLRNNSKYGTDWYPEREQLLLFQEYGTYTFNRNRWDYLDLSNMEYLKALIIKPLKNDLYSCKWCSKEEVDKF